MATNDAIRLLLIALYAPVVAIVYQHLYARLSTISKQLITVMLVAQVVVITLATAFVHDQGFVRWLWNLDAEYNLAATLASAQMALTGFVALIVACCARTRASGQRIYFVGLFILFTYLARDEFFQFRDASSDWVSGFSQLGLLVALATALLTLRLPRRQRVWGYSILVGLAIGALGGLYLDNFLGPFATWYTADDYILYIFLEEALEFLGMWLALLGVCGFFSDALPKPAICWRSVYLLPLLWAGVHHAPFINRYIEYIPPPRTMSASINYADELAIKIFQVDQRPSQVSVQFYAANRNWEHFTRLGYSMHLVDQVSGESYAGINRGAHRFQQMPYHLPGKHFTYVYKQEMEIALLPSIPQNRALWIVLTVWMQEGDDFIKQRVLSSDFRALSDTQVVLGELVVAADAMPPSTDVLARFADALSLEAVSLPSQAYAGEDLTVEFMWYSNKSENEELVQFLHLVDRASGQQWGYDQQPLGQRLPSRLLYNGLRDSEIWRIPLPAELAPGRYAVYSGLYRQQGLERLPARESNGAMYTDARVPLGDLLILNR